MSQISHLHDEAEMLPVRSHCKMKNKQFLFQMKHKDHPNHRHQGGERPARTMRKTLNTEQGQDIRLYTESFDCENLGVEDRKVIIKNIHTEHVRVHMEDREDNKVLGIQSPRVALEERGLSRRQRTRLAQLRSGYSPMLATYKNRLDPPISSRCPECGQEEHTSTHLFQCTSKPTELTVEALWTRLVEAAEFLGLGDDAMDEVGEPRMGVG